MAPSWQARHCFDYLEGNIVQYEISADFFAKMGQFLNFERGSGRHAKPDGKILLDLSVRIHSRGYVKRETATPHYLKQNREN